MKSLIIAAGVAAFALAAPAHAGPGKGGPKHRPQMGHHFGYAGHAPGYAGHAPGYGVRGCPPGLANKPMCMPPGQFKKRFRVGQRLPYGYPGLLGYNALPYDLRARYGGALDPRSRYIYDDSYLYRVDPRTLLVQQVLNALIR